MCHKLFYICAITCFINITFAQETLKLVFANMVWRHGARSSLHSFPTDPYNNKSVWPNGPGQLTQIGMKQQFELGQFFRKKYGDVLLDKIYFHKQIYVRSTDVDRTLMSAQSNIAGMYPPSGYELWNGSNTNWQPMPVHTVAEDTDTLLHMAPYLYPEYNKMQKEIVASEEYANLNKIHGEFLKNLSVWSGLSPMNIGSSWSVQDPLACEKAQNLTLPPWASTRVLEELSSLAGLDMGIMFGGIDYQYRVKMAPYAAGPLVHKILKNFEDKIANKTTYNVIAYSAHDTTVSALLVALKAYNWKSPPFASCVIFELYQNQDLTNTNGQYFIKAFFRNSSDTLHPLNLLGCDLLCPLEKLKQLTENIRKPTKAGIQQTTKNGVIEFGKQHYLGVVLTIVIFILMVTWLVVLVYVCKKSNKRIIKRSENTGYQPLTSYDEIANGEI